MDILSIRDASFAFETAAIFEGINLSVGPGEVFCLFGPNGCGKTTLLDTVIGHLRLKTGSIMIEGKDQREYKSNELSRKIAYVPQVHEKTFPYRVIEVVVMGRTPYLSSFSSPSAEDYRMAESALATAGIAHLRDRIYTQLSGGETQLVILARALAQDAPLVILDEPTSHLDFRHELMIIETMARLVTGKKISAIMSSHSPNHALFFENRGVPVRIAVMHEKRIAAIGKPGAILTGEMFKSIFGIDAKVLSVRDGDNSLKHIMPLGIFDNGGR